MAARPAPPVALAGGIDVRLAEILRTVGAAPLAVELARESTRDADGARATPAVEPGLVSNVFLVLLVLAACLFAVAVLPIRAVATISPFLASRRNDFAFGGVLVLGALALGVLASMAS
ncbi:MAG: hypothetical protein M3265_08620 [Actinomycetota bacterium]|nr:hypothetical protein [Actinomycetota bacterium]